MVTTLRDGKAKLSEMVERASRGEDVLITVRGRVKARLTRASDDDLTSDGAVWAADLEKFQQSMAGRVSPGLAAEALDEVREDRV
jgi:prevent-host-death family protein